MAAASREPMSPAALRTVSASSVGFQLSPCGNVPVYRAAVLMNAVIAWSKRLPDTP